VIELGLLHVNALFEYDDSKSCRRQFLGDDATRGARANDYKIYLGAGAKPGITVRHIPVLRYRVFKLKSGLKTRWSSIQMKMKKSSLVIELVEYSNEEESYRSLAERQAPELDQESKV
jgi:hypothetical protein